MISAIEYIKPTAATTALSGKLRTMIEVIALGFIVLLVAVSASQALEQRKKSRHRRSRSSSSLADELLRAGEETYNPLGDLPW
jgi:hypothetical protein